MRMLILALAAPALAIQIPEAGLFQYEDGPPLAATFRFQSGDPVFVSFRLSGYQRAGDEIQRVKMAWSIDVFDPKGVRVVESKSEVIDAPLAREDKNWMPKKRHDFQLPPLIDSGDYRVVITARDELSGKSATRDLKMVVRGGPDVEPSDTLVQRNFRFLRSEDDARALDPPVYRPGAQVWAKFDITGFKLGKGNAFEVAYGLEVFRADGKSMYAEPNAAGEKDATYYPRRYSQGVLNLNLQPDIAAGEYTIALRLTDVVGEQKAESRHTFRIE